MLQENIATGIKSALKYELDLRWLKRSNVQELVRSCFQLDMTIEEQFMYGRCFNKSDEYLTFSVIDFLQITF